MAQTSPIAHDNITRNTHSVGYQLDATGHPSSVICIDDPVTDIPAGDLSANSSSQQVTKVNNIQTSNHAAIEDKGPAILSTHPRKTRYLEKIVYTTSVICLVILSAGLFRYYFITLYYYTLLAPILLTLRTYLYWKLKWQYFLVDFCYFGNAITYVYIWAAPSNRTMFAVVFSVSNGPLMAATVVYRNSLVFHDLDKMTSSFIHLLPAYVTYCVRWHSDSIAPPYWYASFPSQPLHASNLELAIWMVIVPLSCFIVHALLYHLTIIILIKPPDEYLHSFRHLTGKQNTVAYRFINVFGPRYHTCMYYTWSSVMALVFILLALVCYHYVIVHCVYLLLVFLCVTINGGTYYINIFSEKGFKSKRRIDVK